MNQTDWRLPGPASFLEQAAEALKKGVVILDVPASRASHLIPSLREAALESGYAVGGFFEIQWDPAVPPASAIAEAALPAGQRPRTPSPSTIAASDGMDGVLCLIAPPAAAWPRWEPFVSAFLTARECSIMTDPPSLIFLASPGASTLDRRAAWFKFEGVVGRDEARLVFAEFVRGRAKSVLDRLLAVELVVELAGWDLDLVRQLARLRLEDLLNPVSWRWLPSPTDTAISWENGNLDRFENRPFVTLPTVLAAGNRKEIEQRIWRAQIRALFPWLEELRQVLIERWAKRLRLPLMSYDGTEINDPTQLDWGQIQYAMVSRATPLEMRWLEVMKRVRNSLAHRTPASFDDLVTAERDSRMILPCDS